MGDEHSKSMDDLQMVDISQLAKSGNLHSPKYAEKKLVDAITDRYGHKVPENTHDGIEFHFARVISKTT